jgi:hypothetical protein
MEGVNILLKDDGVLVIETPSLDAMIEGLQFDQIYHEHLGYFSIRSILYLLDKNGFGVADGAYNEMHGGSIRIYAQKGHTNVIDILSANYFQRLQDFTEKVKKLRLFIRSYVEDYVPVGIAASAKGNTLLNYCNITNRDIPYITDKSLLKQGRYAPGSHIPVCSDDILVDEQPEYALMLACNFKKNIVKAVRAKGYKGKFIIPYPEVSVE